MTLIQNMDAQDIIKEPLTSREVTLVDYMQEKLLEDSKEISDLKEGNSDLEVELTDAECDILRLENERDRLEDKLDEAKQEITDQEEEIERLEKLIRG